MRLSPHLLLMPAAAAVLAGLMPVAASADDLDDEAIRREIGQKYGECVVAGRRLKPHAIRFVLTGSPKEALELSNGSCLRKAVERHARASNPVTGAWPNGVFRKIVADGLVRTDFATSGPTDFSAVPPMNQAPSTSSLQASQLPQDVQLTLAIDGMAECAARKQPEAVRLLAQTDINSSEELAALRGLAPAFGECLPQDVAANFSRHLLRDAAVLAYARLAYSLTAPAELQGKGQ